MRLPATPDIDRAAVASTGNLMARSEQSMNAREDSFSLTVDQYGRLWLHTKQDGIEISIDLAEKDRAFEIMAVAMTDAGFEHQGARLVHDGEADNDDQIIR